MSTLPENELDLDKLFLPAWAQEPPSAKHYAHYEGQTGEPRDRKRDRRGPRPDRADRGPRGYAQGRPPGEQPGVVRRRFDRKPYASRERPSGDRSEPRERREPPPPLPELNVLFVPDERGVESLARQIKTTGRAYPLFDIARLILQKPERYSVTIKIKKKPDGQIAQPLFVCALDDTLWLSEDGAVDHVLRNHFATFYQTERTATEPPKGKYTFVAQCGMSGVILGPPNYHDYQNQLRKLHADRFSRMPFEVFKSRVKIVRDEEVVKKWIDDQSWKTDYICLNMPEPLRLGNREAVAKHFREIHRENIIKPAEAHTLGGSAARSSRCRELAVLVRQVWEDQRRFPLQIATVLSQQFAGHGLQFFKVSRAITHVSVARPHFLDLEATPVSDGVKRIVDYINAHPRCTRRRLMEALAPSRPEPPAVAGPPEPAKPAEAPAPGPAPSAAMEPGVTAAEVRPQPAPAPEPTPEQTAVVSDLHWLVHQGHVIEFANGLLETAKKPAPRPPKPQTKPPTDHSAESVAATTPAGVPDIPPAQEPESSPASLGPESDQPLSEVAMPLEVGQDSPPALPEAQMETPAAPSETHP